MCLFITLIPLSTLSWKGRNHVAAATHQLIFNSLKIIFIVCSSICYKHMIRTCSCAEVGQTFQTQLEGRSSCCCYSHILHPVSEQMMKRNISDSLSSSLALGIHLAAKILYWFINPAVFFHLLTRSLWGGSRGQSVHRLTVGAPARQTDCVYQRRPAPLPTAAAQSLSLLISSSSSSSWMSSFWCLQHCWRRQHHFVAMIKVGVLSRGCQTC